jgi:hypothetical protein
MPDETITTEDSLKPVHLESWEEPKRILVVLAHPDDPEFFCGATIARWTSTGHEVRYCLLTCGDKGTQDRSLDSEALCALRQKEQRAAAAVLGVTQLRFLGYPDGYLVPDLNLRGEITRVIRQERPDVVVTCDPTTLSLAMTGSTIPTTVRQARLRSMPSTRLCDHLNFIELWRDEG